MELYRLTNVGDHSVLAVSKPSFSIGRAPSNDLAYTKNRFISSAHCTLQFEKTTTSLGDGKLFIRDTSSNGTLINRTKKLLKNVEPVEVKSGDTIHLVFRRDEPKSNIILQVEIIPSSTTGINQGEDTQTNTQQADTQLQSYPSIPIVKPNDTQENADLSALMQVDGEEEEEKEAGAQSTTAPKPVQNAFAMGAEEDMEDVLTCACCQDIMTSPISLEPCLHSFCSDCYENWEAVQRTCPKCRVKVIGKKKNVVINGILEAFLRAYPQKRPEAKKHSQPAESEEEEQQRRKKQKNNEVGPDGLYLNPMANNHGDDDVEMDEDNEYDEDDGMSGEDPEEESGDGDSDEEEDEDFGFQGGAGARFVCPQCPANGAAAAAAPTVAASGAAATPFQCPQGQNHILCQCCVKPMADRRDEPGVHQTCTKCNQFFCNMYFGKCARPGCLGCLNELRNFDFELRHLNNFVLDNQTETGILQRYMTAQKMDLKDLLAACCQQLDAKKFTCVGIDRNAQNPSSKIVCYRCGLALFKDLAYQYRAAMKPEDIEPANLRHRENCHWGNKCRTQHNRPAHATNFNHVCEQTRFA